MKPRAKVRVGAVLALSLATLGLYRCDARYEAAGEPILPNLGFEQGFRHWQGSPAGVGLAGGGAEPLAAVLRVGGPARLPLLTRSLPDPGRFSHVRVAAEIRLEGVRAGPEAWQRGGIILRSLDRRGIRLRHWPERVAAFAGTADWRPYAAVVPVNPDAAAMRLFLYNAGLAGEVRVRRLTLTAASETTWFRVARALLIAAWLVAGLWAAVLLLAPPGNAWRRLAAGVGAVILAATLAPQPDLSDALGAAEDGLNRWLAAFPAGPPEASGGATAGARGEASRAGAGETAPPPAVPAVRFRVRPLPGLGPEETAHLAAYTVLALLLFVGAPGVRRRDLVLYLLVAAVAGEVVQSFVVTRSVQWLDGTMNAAGVGVALGLDAARRALASGLARARGGAGKS